MKVTVELNSPGIPSVFQKSYDSWQIGREKYIALKIYEIIYELSITKEKAVKVEGLTCRALGARLS